MPIEGMVHALNRAHSLLAPGGRLVDLHPSGETARVEADGVSIGTLDAEQADRRHAAADVAIARTQDAGLFVVESAREFWFWTYGDSIEELRDHVHASWQQSRVGEPLVVAARDVMRADQGTVLRIAEHVRITRLRPADRR
jgi:uncharacterized protein YcbX